MCSLLKFLTFLKLVCDVQSHWDPDCETKWPTCRQTDDELYINTACQFESCGPRFEACKEYPPDAEFRQTMLDIHNELRNKLASGQDTRGNNEASSNMMVFSYDLQLEYTAICHVHGCKMEHDKCRGTEKFYYAGQNLALEGQLGDDPFTQEYIDNMMSAEQYKSRAIDWYEEIKDFKESIDSYEPVKATGHFTAYVWAETAYVGCARAIDRTPNDQNLVIAHLTCNYGPAGNEPGSPIYKKGSPCSACPNGLKCNSVYTSLCGEIDPTDLIDGDNPYRTEDTEKSPENKSSLPYCNLTLGMLSVFYLMYYTF